MNIGVHLSFRIIVSSGYKPRSGVAGSYGTSNFSFLRKLHTVFHSGCISLHSHQLCRRVPFSPHSPQLLLLIDIFNDSRSDQCENVVLICISLIISDVQDLFMCLLTVCMSSLEKCQFWSSIHFFDWVVFVAVELYVCSYILEIKPLSTTSFANIFLVCMLFFLFVYGFLCCAKVYKFDKVPLVYFCFYFYCLGRLT